MVSSELDIDAGKAWAGGLRTEEAVPVIPGRRTWDGEPPGTGRVRLSEVSPTTGCRSEAAAGRGGGLGWSSAFGRRGSGERSPRRGRNFGHDSAGRQKVSLPHLPPARPFPPAHPPPPASRCLPADTRVLVGFAVHLPSAVSGLVARSKGLWRPVFRAADGGFVTGEEGSHGRPCAEL